VLACLGVLSTVGVVALFAAAAGLLAFRRPPDAPAASAPQAQAFLENMAEGVLLTAADGTPLWANPAFLKLSAADNDRDLHSIERLFSDNPDASEAVYRLAVAADAGRRATEEIRMPGGIGGRASGARWYRVRVSPVGGKAGGQGGGASSGASGHVGWLIADITREREHQENIFQELQNAIDYLDHAPAGFFSLEPDGRIRYLNATLAEWIGIDLAEFEPGAVTSATMSAWRACPSCRPLARAWPKRSRSTSISCAPTARDCRAPAAPRSHHAGRHGGGLAHAGPRHAPRPRSRSRAHRRNALRALLQQHADGHCLGRQAGPHRPDQCAVRHAVR
jgi:PAS domain-containing protein